ncbi:hypothetical protein ES703_76355 [subsurface metagenome]
MKAEAVGRIRSMVTPKVTIEACVDTPDGIKADIRYEYQYPDRAFGTPITWAKTFTVLADKEGNVYSALGLF